MIQDETVVVQPRLGVAFRRVGDEMAIVHPDENVLIRLNQVGADIWERLDGRPLDAVLASLVERYDVSEERLESDLMEFVSELLKRGLLEETTETK